MKNKLKRSSLDWVKILSPLLIIFFALLATFLLILAVGCEPINAFRCLLNGAFGSLGALINTFSKMVPIAIAGLAAAVSVKGGLFNIGLEGQLVFGGLGAALAGLYIAGLPPFLHIPICLISGMLFGMLYALLPTALYVKKRVSLLVVHILMNNISKLVITYLIAGPFAGDNRMIAATNPVQLSARLPYLFVTPNKLSSGIFIAIFIALALWFYLSKTTSGYELCVCGDNIEAARFAGIKVKWYQAGILLASGAIAGLAGGAEVLGAFDRFYDGFSPGYGFDGIPIAMLVNGNPFGVLVGAFLFGALRVGSLNMQIKAGVSVEIVSVIQGILITLVSAEYIIRFLSNKILNLRTKEAG